MSASISRRAFIQRLPHPPSEQTSTLVLTSSTGRFVDIRILKDALSSGDKPVHLREDQLDWAFAGISHTRPIDSGALSSKAELNVNDYIDYKHSGDSGQGEDAKFFHTVWKHTIDSKTRDAQSIEDEGDMQYLASLGLTLERGSAADPESGKITEYVEGWLDEGIEKIKQMPDCVVFEMDEPEAHAKGILIKLGKYMQGVARSGDHFSLMRLSWDSAWKMDAVLGTMAFPLDVDLTADIKVGDKFPLQSSSSHVWHWTVTEAE